jgi:glycosidase
LQRIDYLEWLGVVWLTPIYVSPMLDFGYDVADFCAIDPTVGTFQEFDRQLAWLRSDSEFEFNHLRIAFR